MNTICGAECGKCNLSDKCPGCAATYGRPFGGACIAAEYIKADGKEKYAEFRQGLLNEINTVLTENNIPEADTLYELQGFFVNLAYPLPSGQAVKFLDDRKIYLGTQIELADTGICCGVAADTNFILVCSYGADGSQPELIAYKKR